MRRKCERREEIRFHLVFHAWKPEMKLTHSFCFFSHFSFPQQLESYYSSSETNVHFYSCYQQHIKALQTGTDMGTHTHTPSTIMYIFFLSAKSQEIDIGRGLHTKGDNMERFETENCHNDVSVHFRSVQFKPKKLLHSPHSRPFLLTVFLVVLSSSSFWFYCRTQDDDDLSLSPFIFLFLPLSLRPFLSSHRQIFLLWLDLCPQIS